MESVDKNKFKTLSLEGITVSKKIGLGDAIQFSSVPENYYRHNRRPIVDLECHWIFDHNPYVVRDVPKVSKAYDLWNNLILDVPRQVKERTVMLSLAEAPTKAIHYDIVMNRPRLYRFESFPFYERYKIILHTKGVSHGKLPQCVVSHVINKYGLNNLLWIPAKDEKWTYTESAPSTVDFTKHNIWELVEFISDARMFIGVDSGPSWIAQCYPDIIVKKVRMHPNLEALKTWVPQEWCRLGSYWDDRSAMIYNPSEQDAGFTWSYKKI